MHDAAQVIGAVRGVDVGVNVEVRLERGYDVAHNDSDILVTIRPALFVVQSHYMT